MGTRGHYVYRYRNIYFVYYSNSDSYPEGLGIQMLHSMRQPNAITKERQRFGEILDKIPVPDDVRRARPDEGVDFIAQKQRPQNDVWIEWTYEIDLDRNIFHIDGIPFYSLECLPTDEGFVGYISKDNYGNLACAEECPHEHKYQRPAPPVVEDSDLATYRSLECAGTEVALSDLLASGDTLCPDEHVRVLLLETMIGWCMARPRPRFNKATDSPGVGQMVCDIEIAFDHNQLTDREWMTASCMVNLAFVPQIFGDPCEFFIYHPELKRQEFTWAREDTVICIATHLDDKRCLQASISRLVDAITEQKDHPGNYFGIAFSVYHCAIVKVVKDTRTAKFSHTAALQFLPSFYADSPSTPGITALARLGYRVDPAVFVRATKVCRWLEYTMTTRRTRGGQLLAQEAEDVPSNRSCPALPSELWREIVFHLHFRDLLHFGFVSKLFRELASMVLRYPHVSDYRLVAVAEVYDSLRAASFAAVQEGIPATVGVGWGKKTLDIPFAHGYSLSVPVSVEEAHRKTSFEDGE
jgi:hypothetical protein